MHKFIRTLIANHFGNDSAENLRILYGGSVNPENVRGLFACKNIDGALIGGASLKISSFLPIIKAAI